MPWRETDAMEQRRHFVVRALSKPVSFSALCQEFCISRKTGYKWKNRFEQARSLAALAEESRRPRRVPNRTPLPLEERVVELRKRYGWSGRKLEVLLRREGIVLGIATIDRIIKRRGLVNPAHSHPKATSRFERSRPNELWQMDFKGEYGLGGSNWCYPLSILDDHSRYLVGLYALPAQKLKGVQSRVIDTFESYGLPEAMLLDHGTPWWNAKNQYGLTALSVFLIKQGIRLIYSRRGHPQTQGKVERFHRTLKETLEHRGKPESLEGFGRAFVEIRKEYNEVRPHEALGQEVPGCRYRPSPRAYKSKPEEWVYPPGADVRRLSNKGLVYYQGRNYFVCEALRGEWVQCQKYGHKVLVTYRHMDIREIDRVTGRTTAVVRPASRGQVLPMS